MHGITNQEPGRCIYLRHVDIYNKHIGTWFWYQCFTWHDSVYITFSSIDPSEIHEKQEHMTKLVENQEPIGLIFKQTKFIQKNCNRSQCPLHKIPTCQGDRANDPCNELAYDWISWVDSHPPPSKVPTCTWNCF